MIISAFVLSIMNESLVIEIKKMKLKTNLDSDCVLTLI